MVANTGMKCYRCGAALTDANSWMLPASFAKKRVPYCVGCQQQFFNWLSGAVGYQAALFFSCAFFNMPFNPDAVEAAKSSVKERGLWGAYVYAMNRQRLNYDNGKRLGFEDGDTDIRRAVDGLDDLDTEGYRNDEDTRRELWGTGPKDKPYSEAEYDELDKQFSALAEGRAYMSEQTRLAIIGICKMVILQNRALDSGDIKTAKDLAGMIKTEKEGEQLRKKDELPQDVARLDDIVKAVERAGLHIPDTEELLTALANHSYNPIPSYGYTYDAAEKMLLYIRNATAWNEGQAEVASLPPEFSFADDPLGEFAAKPDEKERQIYRDLGLYHKTPGTVEKKTRQHQSKGMRFDDSLEELPEGDGGAL